MKNMLKIAVLGGGNSAQTMAADLALQGFHVNLCDLPQFAKNVEYLMKTGEIEKYGSIGTSGRTGLTKLNMVTTDMGEAVRHVDIIIIAVPAYGHMTFYESLAEHLEDGQIVVTLPGNWGALRLFNYLKEKELKKTVKIAETDRCMHICRAAESWLGPGKVRVIIERGEVKIAAIPAGDTAEVLKVLQPIYPQLKPAAHVLETSLNNSNSIVHGPLVLMNAGWIEHTRGQFMIYRDAATPAVGEVVDAIRDERDAVTEGFDLLSIPDPPFYERIKNAQWPKDPCETGPPDLQHRYISEDIPYGLVPLTYLGDLLNVPTPVCDAIIELSSKVNRVNYWEEGLTLESLGLKLQTPGEILSLVNSGSI